MVMEKLLETLKNRLALLENMLEELNIPKKGERDDTEISYVCGKIDELTRTILVVESQS
jgi:hypothetical protein